MRSEVELIARYEAIRRKVVILEAEIDRLDAELVEIERSLPDNYHYSEPDYDHYPVDR